MNTTQTGTSRFARAAATVAAALSPRLSLPVCLGFAVVAILAVVATGMRIVQQSTRETARLTGSLETRYEPALRAARDLEESVTSFERRVTGLSRAARAEDIAAVEASGARMLEVVEAYSRLAPAGSPVDATNLRASLQGFRAQGVLVSDLYNLRDAGVEQCLSALDALETRAARAAGGVESGDRIFALKSLAELSRAATTLRASAMSFLAAPSPPAGQAAKQANAAFAALLRAHTAELATSPGRAWLDLEREDLAIASRELARIQAIDQQLETARLAFASAARELAIRVETELQTPAWQALTLEAGRARTAAERAESHLARVSFTLLGVVLVIAGLIALGIMAPARRLLAGTRRLAQGAFHMPVPRGGVLELDELAIGFNDMASALHSTQTALREQQAALEDRVAERTEQLRHLAHHDPLTGLPNRRELEHHLASAIERARTRALRCLVLYMDVDNFKTINDSLGHQFGDRVLREIGLRLLEVAGPRGCLARLGGDEFTLVVDELGPAEAAEECVAPILRSFLRPVRVDGRDILVNLSVGIAIYPEHGETTDALLRAADSALYQAKDHGRNGFSVYRPELLAAASHRFQTEQGLRRALDAGELLLHFQPEVSLVDMNTSVVEALLRWRQADGRIATAGEFMAVAEQSGLILELSDWVLRRAVEAARQLRARAWPDARVAVNVSPQQFLAGRFVETVERALADAKMPAECLEIELTETALQTGRLAVGALHDLRRMGVAVALDDFGAGFSSLKSIDELPLTRVKLDRSLMKDVDSNTRSAAIAQSVVRLCRELGLTVTAEGIERKAQLEFAAACGDVHVQGYLVARPAPLVDIERFVADTPSYLGAVWLTALPGRDDPSGSRPTSVALIRRRRALAT